MPNESMAPSFDSPSDTCHCPWDLAHRSAGAVAAQRGLSLPYCWIAGSLEARAQKVGRPLPSHFWHPHTQVVVRLTSRPANSEVRASSIHSPAAGYASPLPNVSKLASRADLLAPREALWSPPAMLVLTSMPRSGNENIGKPAMSFLGILNLVSGFENNKICHNNAEESCTRSGLEPLQIHKTFLFHTFQKY